MKMPKELLEREELFLSICKTYPISIPTSVVAKFLGMDVDCLRESIDQGKCRFGVGGRNGLKGNRFSNISTLVFYKWVTMGGA